MAKHRKSRAHRRSTRRHSLGRGKKTKTTAAATRRKNATRQRRARASVHRANAAIRRAQERETMRRLDQMRRDRHIHGSRAHQKWDEARYEMEDYLGY
uniref:Uncharacterized protein n=1 Tax=viral metagenome TaxID=1070528 RepID=A0A6C0BZS9_9ZZZZ